LDGAIFCRLSQFILKENSQEIEAAITKKQQFIGVYIVFFGITTFLHAPCKAYFPFDLMYSLFYIIMLKIGFLFDF